MNDVTTYDERLLEQLRVGTERMFLSGTRNPTASRHSRLQASAPTARTGVVRRPPNGHEAEDIRQHVKHNTVHKYCKLCESMNVDPMLESSLFLALILLSRHNSRARIAKEYLESRGTQVDVDWDRVQDLPALQDIFSSSSDWATLLAYLCVEVEPAAREGLLADAVLQVLEANLRSVGLTEPHTPLEFTMMCLLYMMPAGTPSTKMLERHMTHCQVEFRDVEVKCLRAVAGFTDNMHDEELCAATFLRVCLATRVQPELLQDVAVVLDTRRADLQVLQGGTVHRTKLRDIVQRLHRNSEVRYEQSFDSWCCQKKFSSTTGLNVQRLLYFINAQSAAVDCSLFSDYFTTGMLHGLAMQELSTIDIEPVIAVITSIRVYNNNVKNLIDFRTKCLEGLNVKARVALTQAQILQLYICSFQHESIRERCWKVVLPVYNHSIQRACGRFRETYPFEIEAVIRCIITSHVMDVGASSVTGGRSSAARPAA